MPAARNGGQTKGSAWAHTSKSAARVIDDAMVSLPAGVNGFPNVSWLRWREMPRGAGRRVPVVILLHGSAGVRVGAIEEWQRWLATLGVASVVPDSFALPDRLTYTSPVDKEVYERVHTLRASEIDIALKAVRAASWADPQRVVLAGTSEGAVAVARHAGEGFAGRMVLSWSCEDNYFVRDDRTALAPQVPVLNIISASDPFFTAANPFLGYDPRSRPLRARSRKAPTRHRRHPARRAAHRAGRAGGKACGGRVLAGYVEAGPALTTARNRAFGATRDVLGAATSARRSALPATASLSP